MINKSGILCNMTQNESVGMLFSCRGKLMNIINNTLQEMTRSKPFDNEDLGEDFPLDLTEDDDGESGAGVGEVARQFTLVVTIGICAVLSLFGVVANIVNMVIFVKQGFQESVNITLFAISLSDFFSAITLVWLAICHNPLFIKADLPFISTEIEVLTSGIPHAMAMNATGWLTAFLTFERCMCVAYPLKVKDIITRDRTRFIVAAIFVLVIAAQIPSYYVLRLGWRLVPERNKTMLGIYAIEGSEVIDEVTFYIVNVMGPILTFLCVSACSAILIVQLNMKSKWRQTASNKAQGFGKEVTLPTKDWKVVKMISIVAVIFVTSFTPYVMISTVMASEPEFRFYGKYRDVFAICVSVGSFLESINAASNIFIYYKMSSKYKATFRVMFCDDNGGEGHLKGTTISVVSQSQ